MNLQVEGEGRIGNQTMAFGTTFFSYAIQLFIMMPVRTEEFCPHLHPLVSMYAKWRTKLPNVGEEGASS